MLAKRCLKLIITELRDTVKLCTFVQTSKKYNYEI
jgi:hypothetical protein